MAFLTLNYESHFLHCNHDIGIILPDCSRDVSPKEFYNNKTKYPVLWLLHGTFGDYSDWVRKSKIELYACERNLIVVMPSALNSFYSNWDSFATGYSMWDYLTEELMPLIYNWFPASSDQKDNFIGGLSMGGFGAIKYATAYPEKFAGVAILSAYAYNTNFLNEKQLDSRTKNNIVNAGGFEAFKGSIENTWERMKEIREKEKFPKLYCACGKQDFLYQECCAFNEYMKSLDIQFCFETGEGSHEWRFWDKYIERALDYFEIKCI